MSHLLVSSNDFEVFIDTESLEGSFEWVGGTNEDSEIAGGLWFESDGHGSLTLTDYDGVYELPLPVYRVLRDEGVEMRDDFIPHEIKRDLIKELIKDEIDSFACDFFELSKFTARLLREKYSDTPYETLSHLASERGVTEP